MRLVHLSDLHLGYQQYQRLTPGGINQREADIAKTFTVAVDKVIALAPDLVVIAGDVFHRVRPSNQAILHAFNQFGRLVRSLPDAVVIMVAGNHDTPCSAESGGILQLFTQLGIHVADRESRRLPFPHLDLSVLAVPDVPGHPAFTPDPSATHNVLVVHGEVPGTLAPHLSLADPAAVVVSREELGVDRWSYVALGHHHVYTEIAPNAYYAGSIDYSKLDMWGELKDQRDAKLKGKGFVEHDLVTGEHKFHVLPGSRPLVDLPTIVAAGLSAAEVDARIAQVVEAVSGGIDDKIVRLMVRDLPRHIERELDHRALREYKRRALNFHLDVRRPEPLRLRSASGTPGRRPMLIDVVREKLMSRTLENDIDREEFVNRGLDYLREAEKVAVPGAAVLDA